MNTISITLLARSVIIDHSYSSTCNNKWKITAMRSRGIFSLLLFQYGGGNYADLITRKIEKRKCNNIVNEQDTADMMTITSTISEQKKSGETENKKKATSLNSLRFHREGTSPVENYHHCCCPSSPHVASHLPLPTSAPWPLPTHRRPIRFRWLHHLHRHLRSRRRCWTRHSVGYLRSYCLPFPPVLHSTVQFRWVSVVGTMIRSEGESLMFSIP